jgi:outer membrane protein OmpA-like peptidoglycan-associated protein
MVLRTTVLATAIGGAVLASATAARADTVQGLYIGAGAGANVLDDLTAVVDALPGRNVGPGGVAANAPMRVRWDAGYAADAEVGWGLGNGVRLELEESYRGNAQDHGSGQQTELGVMGNLLYDINFGVDWITPYIGIGAGYQSVSWRHVSGQANGIDVSSPTSVNVSQTLGGFAYQFIVGAAMPIEQVPGLSVTVEYRFERLGAARDYKATASTAGVNGGAASVTRVHADDATNQTVMLGLRYEFDTTDKEGPVGRPPPAPLPAPLLPLASPPAGAALPLPARTYLVFFDWNSAELSPRAHEIIAEAVRNASRLTYTRIEVTGSADRTGTELANQMISLRRAQVVAAELMRWGVPQSVIDIHAVGDKQLAVLTPSGVRSPENRRVEIVYR